MEVQAGLRARVSGRQTGPLPSSSELRKASGLPTCPAVVRQWLVQGAPGSWAYMKEGFLEDGDTTGVPVQPCVVISEVLPTRAQQACVFLLLAEKVTVTPQGTRPGCVAPVRTELLAGCLCRPRPRHPQSPVSLAEVRPVAGLPAIMPFFFNSLDLI